MGKKIEYVRDFDEDDHTEARIHARERKVRKLEEFEEAISNDEPVLDIIWQDDRRGGDPLPLTVLFR